MLLRNEYLWLFISFIRCEFTGDGPINRNMKVGDFTLTTEVSRSRQKKFYYVVKVLEVLSDNSYKCQWYELRNEKKLFVKLNAKWNVQKKKLICFTEIPTVISSKRNGKILFLNLYKFLTGTITKNNKLFKYFPY